MSWLSRVVFGLLTSLSLSLSLFSLLTFISLVPLKQMVDDRDDVLLAAFQVLLEDGVDHDEAFDEFEDTVLRIVRRRFGAKHSSDSSASSSSSSSAALPTSSQSARPDSPSPPDVASRPLTAASERSGLASLSSPSSLIRDECAFVGILASEGALDESDAALLDAAVRRDDPIVRAVLDVFRSDGDMHELLVCAKVARVACFRLVLIFNLIGNVVCSFYCVSVH